MFKLVRFPLEMRRVQVARTEVVTAQMRRVTFTGESLSTFQTLAPEDHVRVYFPRPGEAKPALPDLSLLGRIISPIMRPVFRDYTPRAFRQAECELDIDFFLHGSGVASTWAAQAEPGHEVGIGGPRGSKILRTHFAHHWLIGDETALPEFARRIEKLLDSEVHVFILSGPTEHQYPLITKPHVRVTWIDRTKTDPLAPYEVALSQHAPLPASSLVWLAGEAVEMRQVFRWLVGPGGVAADRVHASGHWKRGSANHDHHEPVLPELPR